MPQPAELRSASTGLVGPSLQPSCSVDRRRYASTRHYSLAAADAGMKPRLQPCLAGVIAQQQRRLLQHNWAAQCLAGGE